MKAKIIGTSMLLALLTVGALAALGSSAVFAQSDDLYDDDADDDDSRLAGPSGNTTTAASGRTSISGVIASLQNNEAGAPTWITSGHWKLQTDSPVFGDDDTEPTVSNFSAIIYMASVTNGSDIHQHEITDFTQTSVVHSSGNATTINGTMTVSMSDGPHQNTSGYINLQNNKVSIWLEPEGLGEEHFGPTPIYGMVLPDSFKMSDDDWGDDRDDDWDERSGAMVQGNMDDDFDDDDDRDDDSDDN